MLWKDDQPLFWRELLTWIAAACVYRFNALRFLLNNTLNNRSGCALVMLGEVNKLRDSDKVSNYRLCLGWNRLPNLGNIEKKKEGKWEFTRHVVSGCLVVNAANHRMLQLQTPTHAVDLAVNGGYIIWSPLCVRSSEASYEQSEHQYRLDCIVETAWHMVGVVDVNKDFCC